MRTCLWIVVGLQMFSSVIGIWNGLAGTVSEEKTYGAEHVLAGCLLLALGGFSVYALWFRL